MHVHEYLYGYMYVYVHVYVRHCFRHSRFKTRVGHMFLLHRRFGFDRFDDVSVLI